MEIVRQIDAPFRPRPDQPREGRFEFSRLLEGEPGRPDNFLLQLSRTWGDYRSPRHRHNFDQLRYQIEGRFDFGTDGTMVPGTIAYFPEGTHYGPQTSGEDSLVLILQCGGPGGSGYLSDAELTASVQALKAEGEFKGGVFTRTRPDGRRVNQDAYEAAWEHRTGRKLAYPEPRYQRPVFMNPDSFGWVPAAGEPGVAHKALGTFHERGLGLRFLRLDAGAAARLDGPSLHFVVSGEGRCDARPWEAHAAFRLRAGERARIEAAAPTVILEIRMPILDGAVPPAPAPVREAAEA